MKITETIMKQSNTIYYKYSLSFRTAKATEDGD